MAVHVLDLQTYTDLFWCPRIKVNRFHFTDVNTEISVDTSTSYAQENTQIPGCPARSCEKKKS